MFHNGNLDIAGLLLNVKIERLATDPEVGTLVESRVWYNTTDKKLKIFNGTEIMAFADAATLENFVQKSGDTMTGALVLSGDATENLHAVTLQQLTAALSGKQDTITGAASTITSVDLTASRALVADASGKVAVSTTTLDELAFVSGVTSAIQTQIDSKQDDLGYVPVNKAGDSMSGDLNLGGSNTVTGLSAPVNATDAVRKVDIENMQADLDFQADVMGVQLDNTLVPAIVDGTRYIVTDVANLEATFGVITGVENNDIVEYDAVAGEFVVAYDVSVLGEGVLTWDQDQNKFMKFDGTTWTEHGGLSGVTAGSGLEKNGNTIYVDYDAGTKAGAQGGVAIDLATAKGLALVDPVSGELSTADDAQVAVVIDAAGSLQVSATGLDVKDGGVGVNELAGAVAGLGIEGGAGSALTVKLADASLVKDATGVKVGDLSATYLAKDVDVSTTGQITVPAPTADGSAANKLYVDNLTTTNADAITALSTRVDASQVVYDGTLGTAQTTYPVIHNMNNKYVSVAVYSELDSQIIPDAVDLTDANTVTVTLATAQKVRIVVTGKKINA